MLRICLSVRRFAANGCRFVGNGNKLSVKKVIFIPKKKETMDKTIPFSPYVVLVDASYINKVGENVASYFSKQMNRVFPKADLALLLEYMAMDAGIQPGDNKIQVIFIYDGKNPGMDFCLPSCLSEEIHGKAFNGPMGEFSLYAFQPSGLATKGDLFMEALQLADASKDVGRVLLVPDEETYGTRVSEAVKGMEADKVVVMGMNPRRETFGFRFEVIGFPLLKAYGITPDEV